MTAGGVSFAIETVHIVRPPWITERGRQVQDWRNAPDPGRPVPGCTGWPGPSSEHSDRRDGVVIARTELLPAGTDVLATDGVRIADELFKVEGRPQVWRSPTGALDSVVVELIRWEG